MKLSNEITVDAEPDRLFALLTDVGTVAPCLPGATLEGSDGDTHRGTVKVKLGPISAGYAGTVRFVEVDREARRVVLDARGVDQYGSGNAEATVSARVQPAETGSVLIIETDLLVRGKVAQFGRGVLADVSAKLLGQFADNLGALLNAPATSPTGASAPIAAPQAQAQASVNGLALVATPLLKRAAPVLGALALAVLGARLLGRRRRGGRVLVDEIVLATIRINGRTMDVPVRQVISVLDQ